MYAPPHQWHDINSAICNRIFYVFSSKFDTKSGHILELNGYSDDVLVKLFIYNFFDINNIEFKYNNLYIQIQKENVNNTFFHIIDWFCVKTNVNEKKNIEKEISNMHSLFLSYY